MTMASSLNELTAENAWWRSIQSLKLTETAKCRDIVPPEALLPGETMSNIWHPTAAHVPTTEQVAQVLCHSPCVCAMTYHHVLLYTESGRNR